MAYLFLACPKCHAAYKIQKEHAETEVVCRSCGTRWTPGRVAAPPPAASAPSAAGQPTSPAAPAPPTAPAPAPARAPAPAAPAPVAKAAPAAAPAAPVKPAAKPAGPASALEALAQAAAGRASKAPAAPATGGAKGSSALDALAQAAAARAGGAPAKPVSAPAKPAPPVADPATPTPAPAVKAGDSRAAQAMAASTPSRDASAMREDKTDPLVGVSINGFKIISRIGTGGFGVVYRAFDTNLERSVAIKMLPPKIAKAGQGLLERFLREARSAAKLSHPNIVTIHQICPYRDTFYIVMELVEGGALHEMLALKKRFDPAEATRVIRAAAEGLGHAHRRGIIHRDIKPGNIMLTNDGVSKVSDFGLARDVLQREDIVGPGHSLGTPRYMAPEQALGEEPTAASDLYSLAATYYALLTGRAPFEATNDREVMRKHVTDPVPDPRQIVPGLPVTVFRFFEKAMAKEPEDRYTTSEEFTEALDRLDFQRADSDVLSPQALGAQLGRIAAEDRGAHLSEALGRAVKRSQRQRTPTPQRPISAAVNRAAAKKKPKWLIWALVIGGAVIVIGGAIGAAIYLSSQGKGKAGGGTTETPTKAPDAKPATVIPATPGEKPPEAATPGTTTPETTAPATTPSATPTETPAEPPKPAVKPPAPAGSNEEAAQAALKEAKEYEVQPNTPPEDAIRVYQENILDIKAYAKTQAAEEARKAVERLKNAPPKK